MCRVAFFLKPVLDVIYCEVNCHVLDRFVNATRDSETVMEEPDNDLYQANDFCRLPSTCPQMYVLQPHFVPQNNVVWPTSAASAT